MTKPVTTFISDEMVSQLRTTPQKKSREGKYARRLAAIKRRAGEWGVVYQGSSNAYCHTCRYNLRKRFNESTGWTLEWAILKNPDKAGRVRWTLVARVPKAKA